MTARDLPKDWIVKTLERARDSVAKWPEWKKIAYRVIEDPSRPGCIINPPHPDDQADSPISRAYARSRGWYEAHGPMVTLPPVAGAQVMNYTKFANRSGPRDEWHTRCVYTPTVEELRRAAGHAAEECRRLRQEWYRMLFFGVEDKPEGIAIRRARNAARKRATALQRELRRRTKPGTREL